ncbi:hypothetical protein FA13DRAFT_1724256 [Coprinellus micaceus]|uniref:Uncharacterized protein n=1 Tax=Coprinellus micaceus TaxID=71717 RepID=A0A4Y7U186_COPMI|nr:hypothetical protein FA13DRAFT_1724256 [Coprinellus micaceus]
MQTVVTFPTAKDDADWRIPQLAKFVSLTPQYHTIGVAECLRQVVPQSPFACGIHSLY